MNPYAKPRNTRIAAMISSGFLAAAFGGAALAANPCAPKNPCAAKAANPCAAKNPCAAGAKIDPKQVLRPAGYKPYKGSKAALIAEGERLARDAKLSTNGAACMTCHQANGAYQATFAKPYPHAVQMATDIGIKKINLDEMIQLCMLKPMAAKPLPWDSKELASLVAYFGEVQKGYKPGAAIANPGAAKNPCAAKANPCAAKKM